jgi:hypothetical protein
VAGGNVIESVLMFFVFGSTGEVLPLCAPLPLADILVTLPLAHLRARVLRNISIYNLHGVTSKTLLLITTTLKFSELLFTCIL